VRRALWGSVLLLAGLLLIPAGAGAATYDTYVGCDTGENASPADVCPLGSSPGAFFEADEGVEYDVCVEFPDGEFLCAEEQEAEAGVLYANQIETTLTGEHFVWWFVGGLEVGSWSFRIDAPPPPAPPAPAPPPPPAPPAAVTPIVTPACVKAKARVRTLKTRLRQAVKPKPKARLRGKLKAARSAARRLC
jgi:hypothetical protein